MGVGASKPADRDKKLRDRSQDDDNDNDIDLDQRGAAAAPGGNIYNSSFQLLAVAEQRRVAGVAKAESAQLQSVADAQTTTNAVSKGADQGTAPPKVKNKAAKIAALLFGGAVIGAGIMTALFLTRVIKAAEEADTTATTTTTTTAPGAPEFQKVVTSFASLPENEFWPAYKTVIDQFDAGLEVQKLVAAYVAKITAPNYYDAQGTAEFATKQNYQAAAQAIVAKVMATANKDPLLAYDEVAKADKSTLLLGRPQLESGANATRLLRVGLLIVVLDQLMAANK